MPLRGLAAAAALCAVGVAAPTSAALARARALAVAASRCHGSRDVPRSSGAGRARQAVLCLVNEVRADHGLEPLRLNGELSSAAQAYSRAMASHHFFSHTSPDGRTLEQRLRHSGYASARGGWTVGENLGWGTFASATPAVIVQAWLDSPPHRSNLLARGFREAGIGISTPAPSGKQGATYTLDFGTRG